VLLLAYWTPRALVTAPHTALERWLLRTDARVLGSGPRLAVRRAPRWVRELLELSYLMVYPLVPLSLAVLLTAGAAAGVDRFWTTVLLSEFVCYGLLPLFPTRPPRAFEAAEQDPPPSFSRTLNTWVLANASNQWNTFPSGHVAGAVACGLALVPDVPLAGAVVLSLAALIAVASVAGRYHYAADAVAGLMVALLAFVVARV
jgi:membrane-associated phospholipid phosphatase